ncbi:hypothetical protein [Faecalicatena contorta]|uniref:hypothetical protein n=1 Tax=Faecalicatena contorta TaxID=39482 RepID=UPI001F245FDC|nr:hypothetical protein [Faecalicatena contorta]MCF2554407.1 hypothetical protein [Faecalicatena contorta]
MEQYKRFLMNEQMKSSIKIYEDSIKKDQWYNMQMCLANYKSLLREEESERKKARVDVLRISENGEVISETKNLRIKSEARRNFNFQFPEIIILKHLENQSEKLFLFYFEINGSESYFILEPVRCSSGSYLLRKINGNGGEVFAPNLAMKKDLARQLITLCVKQSTNKIWLPDKRGWIEGKDGKITFFNGKWTWEEAKKCAE